MPAGSSKQRSGARAERSSVATQPFAGFGLELDALGLHLLMEVGDHPTADDANQHRQHGNAAVIDRLHGLYDVDESHWNADPTKYAANISGESAARKSP